VLEHVREAVRLRRPEIPSWALATDLTFGQLRLLFWLQRHGPASMTRLAAWLGVDPATATGTMDRMERHGLATRAHRTDDRRVVECRITDAGAALVTEIDGLRMDAMRQALGLLNPTELAEFDRLLTLIIARSKETTA
jgi:DNA-binding MarR family transcriptional regulator